MLTPRRRPRAPLLAPPPPPLDAPQLSNNQCSDAVWQMALEIMRFNKARAATGPAVDAASEKVAMTAAVHPSQVDDAAYPDGEKRGESRGGRGYVGLRSGRGGRDSNDPLAAAP